MLARVAESIYWMSRQVERAENLARFLDVTCTLQLDQVDGAEGVWWPLVQITADTERFQETHAIADQETVTHFLLFDRDYHSSILTCLMWARDNARHTREVVSSEVYEAVNDLYQYVLAASKNPQNLPDDFLVETRRLAIQWTGVIESTMPRDLAWHFVNVGRLIERADKTSRMLDVKYFHLLPDAHPVGTAVDDLQWATLLKSCSGIEAYRQKHQFIDVEKVIDFFLFYEGFPRSVQHCLLTLESSLTKIADASGRESASESLNAASEMIVNMNPMTAADVIARGMHEFVNQLQIDLNAIGEGLHQDYFGHGQAA